MNAATIDAANARTALLDAADDLFYRRGISDVGMSEIRDMSGLSMRRVYAIASSKSDLVTLWLHHRHATWMSGFAERVDTARNDGADPVDAIFDALAAWMVATSFRGCGFINTHAEVGELTADHPAVIRLHKAAVAAYLTELLRADEQVGKAVAVLVDGAIVQSSIFSNIDPIRAAQRAARAFLESASS